jgi:Arsenite-resistance protein 2.
VEKFIQANTQELAKDKWLCPLSGKKFKGPEFVRKHIFNKHSEKVEEVKKEVGILVIYLRCLPRKCFTQILQKLVLKLCLFKGNVKIGCVVLKRLNISFKKTLCADTLDYLTLRVLILWKCRHT